MSANDRSPLVSIGMPVYNGERFVRQALDSLLRQDYPNLELIISDNGSSDGTRVICREYAARDPRIHAHRRETTVEAIQNFNDVLQQAKGDLFMWAACDDLWEPSFVNTLVELLCRDPDAVLAFAAFDNIDEHGASLKSHPGLFDLPASDLGRRLWNFLMQKERFGKANLIYGLMRTQAIRRAGGCRSWGDGDWGLDMLVVFRLLSLGKLALSRELLFHKRLLPAAVREPASFAEKLLAVRSKIRDKRGYLSGYKSILREVPELPAAQQVWLRTGLARQTAYLYWRELMQLMADLFSGKWVRGNRRRE